MAVRNKGNPENGQKPKVGVESAVAFMISTTSKNSLRKTPKKNWPLMTRLLPHMYLLILRI